MTQRSLWYTAMNWFTRRRLVLASIVVGLVVASAFWVGQRAIRTGGAAVVVVGRGDLPIRVTATGTLRPVASITYRSPLAGRETEITFLALEGTRVNEGDLLVRLDASTLRRELERAEQDLRQAELDLQVSEIERQEGLATVESLSEGEAALAVDEAKSRLAAAERRAARLREEHATLEPLLEKGFITREELRKTSDELERAEEELGLMRRRSDILVERTYPQDRRKAELQLAHKVAQLGNTKARVAEMRAAVEALRNTIEQASIYAAGPGLVVYEEYLNATPRRKIRVGDRVTESQGLVTIPEVARMEVEASIAEADVQRLRPGQVATVVMEAFRDRRLSGRVTRVGTLARGSRDGTYQDRRFDVIVEVDPSDLDLRPEMTAMVDILLEQRAQVLLVPVNAVFDRDGRPVAHVLETLGFSTRSLRLGDSSETHVEVLEGLSEGDRVSLLDVVEGTPTGSIETRPPDALPERGGVMPVRPGAMPGP